MLQRLLSLNPLARNFQPISKKTFNPSAIFINPLAKTVTQFVGQNTKQDSWIIIINTILWNFPIEGIHRVFQGTALQFIYNHYNLSP